MIQTVMRHTILLAFLMQAVALAAIQHTGLVRSADQPIPGATVTAVQGGARLTAVTDENGFYVLDLTPGPWDLEVEVFGFETARRSIYMSFKDFSPTTLDWVLHLKGSGDAPAAAAEGGFRTLDLTQRAEVETQAAATVEEMEAADAASPAPEAPDASANDAFLVSGSLSRGLQEAPPPPDPAQAKPARRARRETGSTGVTGYAVSAPPTLAEGFEGGRSPKGVKGARGVPKKAAGKKYSRRNTASFGNKRPDPGAIRGMAYANMRDSALDARPFSLSGQKLPKPEYSQHRFGISAGGQLRIPHVIESERAFFYFNYSGTRSRHPYQSVITLPSPAERGGDFSQSMTRWPVQVFDPETKLPFPDNRIPKSRFNSAALGLLEFIPSPNLPGRVQNYEFGTSILNDTDTLGTRFNQGFGRRDRMDFNVNFSRRRGRNAQPYGFIDRVEGGGLSSSAGWVHNFGPRRVHTFRWNFSRNRSETLPHFAHSRNVALELGISGMPDDPMNWGPPNLSFTNFGDLSDGASVLRRDQTSTVQDSLLIVKKGHNVTIGGEFRRAQINSRSFQTARGSYVFSGLMTSGFDGSSQPLPGTGYDFADFLLGFPQSSNIKFGGENTYFRSSIYAAYVQDDWRVRPNLSFNLGLRYEYFPPFTEKRDRIANLDVEPHFTGVAVVTPGTEGPYTGVFPRGLVDPDKNNVSPRIAFAWRPSANRGTQIRGGYSIFYNGSIYNQFPNRLASQPPFAKSARLNTSTKRRLTIQDGFADAPSDTITNSFAVDRFYEVGYAQTFNFHVQQNLPHALVLDVGYLGTKGTRLDIQRQPNRAAPGSPLTAEQRRQIGNAVGFTFETSSGNSIYHGLQVRLVRRFQKGLSGNLLYTWSKSIDNVSTYGGGGVTVAQNDKDLRAERGLSTFDARHAVEAQFMLTSPVGEYGLLRDGGWKMRLLQNWSLSGGLTMSSGTPLTARVLGNLANSGGTGVVGNGRADATGESIEGGRFFNLAAFGLPPAGRYGNAGRNTVPGPSRFVLNAAFGRSFRLGEGRRTIEWRLDANNVLNHVSYSRLETVVNALTYGLPMNTLNMRSITSILRFRF